MGQLDPIASQFGLIEHADDRRPPKDLAPDEKPSDWIRRILNNNPKEGT